jgi:hypothetical protein
MIKLIPIRNRKRSNQAAGDLAASARFDDGSDRHDDHAAQQQKRRELDLPQELEKVDEG